MVTFESFDYASDCVAAVLVLVLVLLLSFGQN